MFTMHYIDNDDLKEIFIETDDIELANDFSKISNYVEKYLLRGYRFENKVYLVINILNEKVLIEFLYDFVIFKVKDLSSFKIEQKDINERYKIEFEDKKYVEVISIQSPKNN